MLTFCITYSTVDMVKADTNMKKRLNKKSYHLILTYYYCENRETSKQKYYNTKFFRLRIR